jgi:hypothetical protein
MKTKNIVDNCSREGDEGANEAMAVRPVALGVYSATMRPMALVLLMVAAGGCAQRTLTIKSEPSGALVWLNDLEVGRTPVTVEITEYGDYEVILRKEGYETTKTSRALWPPVYMIPPADLASEMVGASDHTEWTFALRPTSTQPTDLRELIARGEELRTELRSSQYTRPATTRATTRATSRATRPATSRAAEVTRRSWPE